jgi:ribonucleoside-diphosphate reductase alpha chain
VAPSTTPASERPTATAAASSNGNGAAKGTPASLKAALGNLGIGKNQVTFSAQADAPSCAECGSIMVRNGSCYKCLNCGSTSGCS